MNAVTVSKNKSWFSIVAVLLGVWAFCALTVLSLSAANPVPSHLPEPPGKSGDTDKPLQVYIMAGQSNMVGFGQLKGARCPYDGIFASADPALPKGRMSVDRATYNIIPLGIYASADSDAEEGAEAAVYKGAYDKSTDYSKAKPAKKQRVDFGVAAESLPALNGPHTVVVQAFVEVPQSGKYTINPGLGASANNVAKLDGKEVYRQEVGQEAVKQTVELESGKRYPLEITYFKTGSMALFLSQEDLLGRGDLEVITNREGKFQWLTDDEGEWTQRQDVYFEDARLSEVGQADPLSPTANGRHFGPELGFGYVIGTYHDAQVLLIKTAQGNRSLNKDFRPPSSGRTDPDSKWEGREYRLMIEGVHKVLDNIDTVVPNYAGQGYEIAGFVWWQGHKDKGQSTEEYEKHLVNLINDVRKEFDVPDMPAAVATVGFSGYGMGETYMKIWQAQMNVADPEKHPKLAKTVASVDTRPFWRDRGESPSGKGYHYNLNAETYMLTGDALGRAMAELQGGKAEPLPLAEKSKAKADHEKASKASVPKPSKEAVQTAQKPIVMNSLIPSYVEKHREQLQREAAWEKAKRTGKFAIGKLDGSSWRFGLTDLYREVGIHDYDWERFGPQRDKIEWQYYSFDPPEEAKKGRWQYRDITLPEGMENWFKPEFDAEKAGWKTGHAPFAFKNGELAAMRNCGVTACRCGEPPKTLWEEETLLMRTTVKVPKLDPEYRYRLVIGGMSHVYAGDGVAVYIDGKKVYEQSQGVGKRQGALPVGFFINKELAKEFEDGEVTIAAKAFRGDKGYIAIWMQKMKMPPLNAE